MLVRELLFQLGFDSVSAERGAKRMDKVVVGLKRNMARLATATLAAAVAGGFAFQRTSDEMLNLDARVKSVTKSSEEFAQAQKDIFDIAQRTRAPIAAMTDLYVKMGQATEDVETISQPDLAKSMEAFAMALTLSGSTGAAADAAVLQFGQGLSSKALSGDELKTQRETNFQFLRALMKASGKDYKELMKMAENRQLTPEFIISNLNKSYGDLQERFLQLPRTGGQAYIQFMNIIKTKTAKIAKETGSMSVFVGVFDRLAEIVGSKEFESTFVFAVNSFALFLRIITELIGALSWFINKVARAVEWMGGLEGATKQLTAAILALLGIMLIQAIPALALWAWYIRGLIALNGGLIATLRGLAVAWIAALWPIALVVGGFLLLYLAIEDVITLIQGGDSFIGKVFEGWSNIFKAWLGYARALYGFISKIFGAVGDDIGLDGVEAKVKAKMNGKGNPANWMNAGYNDSDIARMARGGAPGGIQQIINTKQDVNINIPPGTPKEQSDNLKKEVQRVLFQERQREYRQTLNDYTLVE